MFRAIVLYLWAFPVVLRIWFKYPTTLTTWRWVKVPSADHWFGTTIAGNDVFAMMVRPSGPLSKLV